MAGTRENSSSNLLLHSAMSKQSVRRLGIALFIAVLLIVALTVSLIIVIAKNGGSTDSPPSVRQSPYDVQLKQDLQAAATLGQQFRDEIANNGLEHIKRNFHNITNTVHVAGTKEQLTAMQYVKDVYTSYGLEVLTTDYDVMLSYPDYNNPNTISMQHSNGSWSTVSSGLADVPTGPPELVAQLNADKRAFIWWNAFGVNGSATGRLVYANYGRVTDYQFFDNNNISLHGSIVLVRYGQLFRGDKVLEAEKRGAVAVVLYSDPIDYGSPNLSNPNDTFPNGVFMPAGGAQRGTLLEKTGDPLTPLYPSKPYTYRINISEVNNGVIAPSIPVMPIGYRDAVKLFQNMDGVAVPDESWKGGIQGVNYTLTSSVLFRVTVNAITQPRQKIRNVFAFMRGSTEPDKYILLTNHVDAWTFGAMDPNSGTVAILETARALTTVAKATDWRPKRTIVFCSVDAEEFGLVGSTEFVEEYLKILQQRTVALVNVDIAVQGNVVLDVGSTPTLYRALVRAAKLVGNPNDKEVDAGRKTVYDSWIYYVPNGSFVPDLPQMVVPNSGSDMDSFLSFVGVPCADIEYNCDPNIHRECYELYHTAYEVPWTFENQIDPGYKALTAMTQFWTEITRDLSDSLIIPFDINDYAAALQSAFAELDRYLKSKGVPDVITNGVYSTIISNLNDSLSRFSIAAGKMQKQVDTINSGTTSASVRQVEMLNSRLMGFERVFINERGLYAKREDERHVLFAQSVHDRYDEILCPGVYDSVEYYFESADTNQQHLWLKSIEVTLSELQYAVESAILLLDLTDY